MTVSNNSNVAEQLAALQLTFKQQLPGKISAMESTQTQTGDR